MTDEKPFRHIRIEQTIASYQAITAIVLPALRTVLEDLAKEHGNKGGKWLDQLEVRLIRDAKGTITDGAPIEVEAASLKVGIDILQATLDVVRHGLVGKEED